MKTGGFLKTSMIDFPGIVSCVVFTSGCNFLCPYCHNPDLATGRVSFEEGACRDEKEIIYFLGKRKNLLDGVVISGGEPTLQNDLEKFCFKVKNMGYKVKLDTNGSNPKVLENLFKKELVDFVAMDVKTNLERYYLLTGKNFDSRSIAESVEVICCNAPSYEFRTTCVKPFVDKSVMHDIGQIIQGASNYVLQQCSQDVNMLQPDFFKDQNMFFSDKELVELKSEVEVYVNHCYVR